MMRYSRRMSLFADANVSSWYPMMSMRVRRPTSDGIIGRTVIVYTLSSYDGPASSSGIGFGGAEATLFTGGTSPPAGSLSRGCHFCTTRHPFQRMLPA